MEGRVGLEGGLTLHDVGSPQADGFALVVGEGRRGGTVIGGTGGVGTRRVRLVRKEGRDVSSQYERGGGTGGVGTPLRVH
jgi:hypothetical protein